MQCIVNLHASDLALSYQTTYRMCIAGIPFDNMNLRIELSYLHRMYSAMILCDTHASMSSWGLPIFLPRHTWPERTHPDWTQSCRCTSAGFRAGRISGWLERRGMRGPRSVGPYICLQINAVTMSYKLCKSMLLQCRWQCSANQCCYNIPPALLSNLVTMFHMLC